MFGIFILAGIRSTGEFVHNTSFLTMCHDGPLQIDSLLFRFREQEPSASLASSWNDGQMIKSNKTGKVHLCKKKEIGIVVTEKIVAKEY